MELRSMVAIEAFKTFLGPLMSLFFRVRAEGVENVPEEGPAMIISNHRCYLDPLVLAEVIPRYINFAAGSHLYGVPGTEPLFRLAGFFKMNIYGGEEGERSLDEAALLLSRGEVIGLFPEGIESFMNLFAVSRIASFKTGFSKVALENRVPVIPVAIAADEEREFPHIPGRFITPFVKHPRAADGITLITYRGVTIRVGRPIDLSPYYGEPVTKYLMDHVSGKIRRIIIRLYDGDDLERLMTGEKPFDFVKDRV